MYKHFRYFKGFAFLGSTTINRRVLLALHYYPRISRSGHMFTRIDANGSNFPSYPGAATTLSCIVPANLRSTKSILTLQFNMVVVLPQRQLPGVTSEFNVPVPFNGGTVARAFEMDGPFPIRDGWEVHFLVCHPGIHFQCASGFI
jgi:hypothetical protein